MFDLGDAAAMSRLSAIILRFSANMPHGKSLHDQIFRKYVQLSDVDHARSLMSSVQNELRQKKSVELDEFMAGSSCNDDFSRYFDAFEECAVSCRSFYEDWGELKPVRVARIDMPAYLYDTARSLQIIDALADGDEPLWKL